MPEVQNCESSHEVTLGEDMVGTFFCELPQGHQGDHACQDQNGVSGRTTWPQEPQPAP